MRMDTRKVRGDGVVGEQPILKPGETFEYSGTPLNTSSGLMHGSYFMTNEKGNKFEVNITFSLDIPNSKKLRTSHERYSFIVYIVGNLLVFFSFYDNSWFFLDCIEW